MKRMIAAGVLCLTIPLLLAACSASNAAESRPTEEVKAEISEETEAQDMEAAEEQDTEKAETAEPAASPAATAPSEAVQADQSAAGEDKPGEQTPAVYFTSDISAEGLVKIYETLGWEPAEMVKGFSDHVGSEHVIYINVMNRLSVDCDCDGNPAEPDIHDIGILAGHDPVALDQACLDLVYQAEGNEALVNRIESLHGIHTLEHAEEIGLGSRNYELVNIDE